MDNRLEVLFQPIYNNKTRRIDKLETLTRLFINNETYLPVIFIPILEERGLIEKYTLLVLQRICLFICS